MICRYATSFAFRLDENENSFGLSSHQSAHDAIDKRDKAVTLGSDCSSLTISILKIMEECAVEDGCSLR